VPKSFEETQDPPGTEQGSSIEVDYPGFDSETVPKVFVLPSFAKV